MPQFLCWRSFKSFWKQQNAYVLLGGLWCSHSEGLFGVHTFSCIPGGGMKKESCNGRGRFCRGGLHFFSLPCLLGSILSLCMYFSMYVCLVAWLLVYLFVSLCVLRVWCCFFFVRLEGVAENWSKTLFAAALLTSDGDFTLTADDEYFT